MPLSRMSPGKKSMCAAAVATLLMCAAWASGAHRSFAAPPAGKPYPILAPCTRYDDRYASMFFKTEKFDDWPDVYHERVGEVIEEYLEPPETIQCYDQILIPLGPTSALGQLASELAPWQDPADRAKLDRNDVGIVLLEFLRMYECALVDHNYYLPMDVITERFEEEAGGTTPLPTVIEDFTFDALLKEMGRRRKIITEEVVTSRAALQRVLMVISGVTRLSPIDAELECLQRASLDLRNGLGLAADASVCMPRAWDTKDSLRDL